MEIALQSERSECGVACLAMLASHHGRYISLTDLRSKVDPGGSGLSVADLCTAAQELGLQGRGLRLEVDEISQVQLPCIVHLDSNHFVVLVRQKGNGFLVADPAIGWKTLNLKQFGQRFTGIVVEVLPTANFHRVRNSRRLTLSDLLRSVRGLSSLAGALVLVSLLIEALVIFTPFFAQLLIDRVIPARDDNLLLAMTFVFVCLACVQAGATYIRSVFLVAASTKFGMAWKSATFEHMLKLPVSWFEKRSVGDTITRFDVVGPIQSAITGTLVTSIIDGVLMVASLGMMYMYSPSLAGVAVGASLLAGIVRAMSDQYMTSIGAERLAISARERGYFVESLRAVASLKLFCAERTRVANWVELANRLALCDNRMNRASSAVSSGIGLIFSVESLVVMALAVSLITSREASSSFTIGMLFAFLAYRGQFASRAQALLDAWSQLRLLGVQITRLGDIVLARPEPHRRAKAVAASSVVRSSESPLTQKNDLVLRGAAENESGTEEYIVLDSIGFKYGANAKPIVHNISFSIKRGDYVVISGPSGCGKSTLGKLICGLMAPTSGSIALKGDSAVGLLGLREEFSCVMQDDLLLSGSIAQNVAFFAADMDLDRVADVCLAAGISGEIERLPAGYQTVIGDLGVGLSGGQKQRLLLARAMYRQTPGLLLDEATNHLDARSAERVLKWLERSVGLTRILITHQADRVKGANVYVELRFGRVIVRRHDE